MDPITVPWTRPDIGQLVIAYNVAIGQGDAEVRFERIQRQAGNLLEEGLSAQNMTVSDEAMIRLIIEMCRLALAQLGLEVVRDCTDADSAEGRLARQQLRKLE